MKQEHGLSAGQTKVGDARQVEETEDTGFGGTGEVAERLDQRWDDKFSFLRPAV